LKNLKANNEPVISIVVPLYNEEKNVPVFMERLERVLNKMQWKWEVVFALDPSSDRTFETIQRLIQSGYPIRLVTFSRRIGKPLSVLAGLDHSRGDVCVVIDVDLQDPPELIEQMVQKWQSGFKVVLARRISRKGENFFYLTAAKVFYWILKKISAVNVPENTGDFMLLDARVVKEVCRFRERHAFLRGLTAAAGFSTTVISFDRSPRFEGRAKISFKGAVEIALDGIVPFSRVPVRVIFLLGVALLIMGFTGCLAWFVSSLATGFSQHWPVLFFGMLQLGLSGITLAALGLLGEYLVRTYEETRERPLYIVDQIYEADTVPRKISREGLG
jgi:polyisoprenyl-phosphate glycosyltransferase